MKELRLVGLDFGWKRVGVAVADPLRLFARPYGTYEPKSAISELKALAASDGIEKIIVGWPLLPDGSEGEATRSVEQFISRLERDLPDVEIVKLDERHTSELARQAILESGARKKARQEKGRIDAAAAAIILQDYLDMTETND